MAYKLYFRVIIIFTEDSDDAQSIVLKEMSVFQKNCFICTAAKVDCRYTPTLLTGRTANLTVFWASTSQIPQSLRERGPSADRRRTRIRQVVVYLTFCVKKKCRATNGLPRRAQANVGAPETGG